MKNILFLTLILLFNINGVLAKSSTPVIIWASSPVKPDETVIIQTGEPVENVRVELARLEDGSPGTPPNSKLKIKTWTKVEVLQRGVTTLKFVVPADWQPGIYACRIGSGGLYSETALLNAPDVWWSQGDYGETATPGGWLRLAGRCFLVNPNDGKGNHQTAVYLRDSQKQMFQLHLQDVGAFDMQAQVPLHLSPGTYEIWAHNGFGGENSWTKGSQVTIVQPAIWPSEVFNVKELGLETALQKAKVNGGGVVYFPAGEYHVKDSIEIPDRTVLRGERTDLSSVYWLDVDPYPRTLIHGHYFAIENLSLYCQNMFRTFISAEDGEFRMDRVRIRSNAMFRLGRTVRESTFRGRKLSGEGDVDRIDATIHLYNVKYFNITNSDILATTHAIKLWHASNGMVKDTRIQHGRNGFGCESTNKVIIENCLIEGLDLASTGNFFATYFGNAGENFLVKGNQFKNAYGLDQEMFTFDAAAGAYFGKAAKVAGTSLTLAADPVFKRYGTNVSDWRNSVVCILEGKGAGQYRRVVSHEGREWELDKPWQVELDQTSVVSIVPFRGQTIFLDNSFEDGGSLQLYGISINNIISGNKGTRMVGFLNWGKESKGWGWQPSWYNQFLNNEIIEGNNYNHVPTSIGILGTVSTNHEMYKGPLNNCVVLRENTIQSNGLIKIEGLSSDIVAEKNTVKYSKTGILIGKQPWDILLRNNHFEKVENPYAGEGIEKESIIIEKASKSPKN
jgi:hypothetical protein